MVVWGDTIAAIATAPGRGGVAVVRVSGSEAFSIAERLTRIRDQGPGIRVGRIANVDEGVILFFKGPHSYTGEDVVEFQCHGGTVTPRRVLEACLATGARLARRGEFTERAFLNGKLDYDQAESVLDLVDAKTARAADAALEGLSGRKRRELKSLYDSALDLSTRLEHALDVDEGELADDYVRELGSQISDLRSQISGALRRANEGKILREGALVVLAGPPNAGKSSLMNALLNQERAIVTSVPGTTRDVLTERITLGGIAAELSDTAGQRDTDDPVERIGVERARRAVETADVVLVVLDGSQELTDEDAALLAQAKDDERFIVCVNKTDLPMRISLPAALEISAAEGTGINELIRRMEARVRLEGGMEDRMTQQRHIELARRAVEALKRAVAAIDAGLALDMVEIDLREALEALCEITGENASEEVIDRVFRDFCVGK